MTLALMFLAVLCSSASAFEIQLLECEPPDVPIWGGYGPVKEYYEPGDVIHYWCEVDTYIGGNFHRVCDDTGRWRGETPMCDGPTKFNSTTQTSDADPESTASKATDGERTTCTATLGNQRDEWYGVFHQPGELIRVMLFLPKGDVSYSVVLVKPNGEEYECGRRTAYNNNYDWSIQNCNGPNNLGATGLKIKSLTNSPLKICEIQANVLTSPRCVDPHVFIENGYLEISRKEARLKCKCGYTKSRNDKLQCVREGVWNRKNLYCEEQPWRENEEANDPCSTEPNRGNGRLGS